tara:strand:+ start:827 stop:1315 length:489 start_codon:yes stop_codon:yes gene_type:complete
MFETGKIRLFKSTRTAWITPEGELLPCENMEHLSILNLESKLEEYIQEENEEIDRILREEEEAYGEDFHPGFHRFDSGYQARRRLYDEMYVKGYVRIGLWISDNTVKVFEVESVREVLKKNAEALSFLHDVLQAEQWRITIFSFGTLKTYDTDRQVHKLLGI